MLGAEEEPFTIEVGLTLPNEILIEQIQLRIGNLTTFQKHFKLLRIEKDEEMTQQSMLLLKTGSLADDG